MFFGRLAGYWNEQWDEAWATSATGMVPKRIALTLWTMDAQRARTAMADGSDVTAEEGDLPWGAESRAALAERELRLVVSAARSLGSAAATATAQAAADDAAPQTYATDDAAPAWAEVRDRVDLELRSRLAAEVQAVRNEYEPLVAALRRDINTLECERERTTRTCEQKRLLFGIVRSVI